MNSYADLVCSHSSPSIQCKHGITWFTHEDEEYEQLREKAISNPEQYKQSTDDSVGWGYLDGRQVAFDCPKCMEHMQRIQDWIQENEERIRTYLKNLGQERIKEAERLAAIE